MKVFVQSNILKCTPEIYFCIHVNATKNKLFNSTTPEKDTYYDAQKLFGKILITAVKDFL